MNSHYERAIVALLAAGLWTGNVVSGPCFILAQSRCDATEPNANDALGDPLPARARLRLGNLRFRAPSSVAELALSPDGATVVTVGNELIVWDAATGRERWRADAREGNFNPPHASYGVRAAAFSSDSSRFYTTGARNDALIVWDVFSGRRDDLTIKSKNRILNDPQGQSRSVDVSPDAERFALGSADGVFVCDRDGQALYDIANAAVGPLQHDPNDRLTFGGHYGTGRFSPDGKVLAVVTSDRPAEVRLFDAQTGGELRSVALASRLVRMDFSPDGKRIVTTQRDSAVRLYDVATGKQAWEHIVKLANPYENYTSAVTFSPDGKIVAACATDNRIYLIDGSSGVAMAHLTGHHWYPWALAFAPDGRLLYSSGWDGLVRRWDVEARKQLALPSGIHATGVVAAEPDGQTLAYADDSGAIRLVAAENGGQRRTFELSGTEYSQLAFSPDGLRLAGGGTSGDHVHVAVWNLASGDLLYRWEWPKGGDPHSTVESICFTPDGSRLAAAVFRQSAAYVWDLTTGQRTAQMAHDHVYDLSFSPDGKTLATAGWDSIIRFWETDQAEVCREIKVAEYADAKGDLRMYTVCYAPDGGLIATAHLDGTVRIWQSDEMLLRTQIQLQGRFVHGAMCFSPDGLWLATGAMDGAVEVWDPLTAAKVWDGGRHQGYVYTVGFGADSRTLVSGGNDGVCYLWDLRPSGKRANDDMVSLWDDLAGEDGLAAYEAMRALSEVPDPTVRLLEEKLITVKTVFDLDRVAKGDSAEETARKRRLKKLWADKKTAVELAAPVRRAVALLAQLGTPEADRLLRNLARHDPNGEIGRLAVAALARRKRQ